MRAEQKAKREGGAAKGGADSKPDEPNPNIKGEQMWVTSQYLDRHTCPSQRCGVVGGLFFRESAHVQERKNEWARISRRSTKRPPDPADTATAAERLVKDSDDFTQHRRAFVRAAHQLIDEGRCTEADFLENGGWMKSTVERDAPVYFTYCGGMTLANKIQLNAATGRLY
jgi:hypothetical protein